MHVYIKKCKHFVKEIFINYQYIKQTLIQIENEEIPKTLSKNSKHVTVNKASYKIQNKIASLNHIKHKYNIK